VRKKIPPSSVIWYANPNCSFLTDNTASPIVLTNIIQPPTLLDYKERDPNFHITITPVKSDNRTIHNTTTNTHQTPQHVSHTNGHQKIDHLLPLGLSDWRSARHLRGLSKPEPPTSNTAKSYH
jgi:hypothetical protein